MLIELVNQAYPEIFEKEREGENHVENTKHLDCHLTKWAEEVKRDQTKKKKKKKNDWKLVEVAKILQTYQTNNLHLPISLWRPAQPPIRIATR